MTWLDEALESLATRPVCGYRCEAAPTVEPTALAALALLAAGRGGQAAPALDWLAGVQSADGSLGIDAQHARALLADGLGHSGLEHGAQERCPTPKRSGPPPPAGQTAGR